MTIDATVITLFIGGITQPYLQEFLLGKQISGKIALLITAVISFVIASFATWIVGGLAGINLPQFTLVDPSPLLAYLWPKFASVFTLSQLIFQGTYQTPADPRVVAKTAPGTPSAP